MAKEAPPLLLNGKEPTSTGLLFDDILTSMGVGDLLDSDSDEDTQGASIISPKSQKLAHLEVSHKRPIVETSSDSDAAPAAILTDVIKLSPEQMKYEQIKATEQSVRLASSDDDRKHQKEESKNTVKSNHVRKSRATIISSSESSGEDNWFMQQRHALLKTKTQKPESEAEQAQKKANAEMLAKKRKE